MVPFLDAHADPKTIAAARGEGSPSGMPSFWLMPCSGRLVASSCSSAFQRLAHPGRQVLLGKWLLDEMHPFI